MTLKEMGYTEEMAVRQLDINRRFEEFIEKRLGEKDFSILFDEFVEQDDEVREILKQRFRDAGWDIEYVEEPVSKPIPKNTDMKKALEMAKEFIGDGEDFFEIHERHLLGLFIAVISRIANEPDTVDAYHLLLSHLSKECDMSRIIESLNDRELEGAWSIHSALSPETRSAIEYGILANLTSTQSAQVQPSPDEEYNNVYCKLMEDFIEDEEEFHPLPENISLGTAVDVAFDLTKDEDCVIQTCTNTFLAIFIILTARRNRNAKIADVCDLIRSYMAGEYKPEITPELEKGWKNHISLNDDIRTAVEHLAAAYTDIRLGD
ncbi:MAG: hypothetical protein J6D57_11355 [Mogibacterium sp.]|nr:hypothetical protein [Mogibacterium sp.]